MDDISRWYDRARIDYEPLYIALYVSYSVWYGAVLGAASDRRALELLKGRSIIWEECLAGFCMPKIRELMKYAYEQMQLHPLSPRSTLSGQLRSPTDWPSMIEFWYAVRCSLVHGVGVPSALTRLAYDSLYIFMGEVLFRANEISKRGGDAFECDMERFYNVKILY